MERIRLFLYKRCNNACRKYLTIRDDLLDQHSKDIDKMRKFYVDAERQFIEFNYIVPYSENDDDVYSPRLFSLLQYLHAQIDGTLNILTGLLSIKIDDTFNEYMKALNCFDMLSVQQIKLRESGKVFQPFVLDSNYTTPWRSANNKTKHAMPEGAYSARYGNVINSLAALAILHELVTKAQEENFRPYILNGRNWSASGYGFTGNSLFDERGFCRKWSGVFDYPMSLHRSQNLDEIIHKRGS